jgi:uncharacterized lipoprotein YmbA
VTSLHVTPLQIALRAIRGAGPTAALLILGACGSYPLPKIYVLGDAAPVTANPAAATAGAPIIELKPVQVPDYLDSTDIVRRVSANQMLPSPRGQWGERLSVGITRDLVSTLSRQLPGVTIETRGGYEPSRRLLVSVERFEIAPDGRCVLAARWRLTTPDGKVLAPAEEATFVETATPGSDAAAAGAMTTALDALSEKVAVTVKRALAEGPAG